MYRWVADAVVLIHVAFVVFVIVGGFLAIRWHRLLWVHVPMAIWGVLIEYAGWICPLTPLENSLRSKAGEAPYTGDFINHYLLRALYPAGLTPRVQLVLGSIALAVNLFAYTLFVRSVRAR
jgi:hypothetical protein